MKGLIGAKRILKMVFQSIFNLLPIAVSKQSRNNHYLTEIQFNHLVFFNPKGVFGVGIQGD